MKFAAILIATVAAIKIDDEQDLPVLSEAAAALAGTEVADENTIAAIAGLTADEAIDLAMYCAIGKTCAENFETLIGEKCMVEVPAAGCDAVEAMFIGLEVRMG